MLKPIPITEFAEKTGIHARDLEHTWGSAKVVVSLRDLATITAIQIMPPPYRNKLFGNILLKGGNQPRVYEGCTFEVFEVAPRVAKIGQKFIQRSKYQAILEAFNTKLREAGLDVGVARTGPFVALGSTRDGTRAVAQYVPPIMEMNGGSKWALLDGIHRNFIVDASGGTISVVAVCGVKESFPCELHDWQQIKVVEEKPPKEERFFNLNEELFRDLEGVGIDG